MHACFATLLIWIPGEHSPLYGESVNKETLQLPAEGIKSWLEVCLFISLALT